MDLVMQFDAALLDLLHERRRKLLKLRMERFRTQSAQAKVSHLGHPRESVWYHIYGCALLFRCTQPPHLSSLVASHASHRQRDDTLYVAFLGIPRRAFVALLKRFSPVYKPVPRNVSRPGRPLTIIPHQALAVLLMFYASKTNPKFLGMLHSDII